MKKIILCLCLLVALFLHIPQNTTKAFAFEGDYTFYTTTFFEGEGCATTQNGNLFLVECQSSKADQIKAQLQNVVGESVSFEGNQKVFDAVCNALGKTLFVTSLEGMVVVEGNSPKLNAFVTKQGKKINFQVAFDGKRVTVGTPTIFGSF